MNFQSSTLEIDESGRPFPVQQAAQIRIFREARKAGRSCACAAVSVSRSIFALVADRDRAYLGAAARIEDTIAYIGGNERAIFGRSLPPRRTSSSSN